ncbi:MAG: molybdopterin-binding protein, partial [Dehalobacter sp.]|nr:molybdopterin-binding protein [Dehalobacter sp.]
GFAPRDNTPEATMAVVERPAPGIAEAIRAQSLKITPFAMLSRATAGLRGKTLIINFPGSPRAALECLEVFLPVMNHAVETLRGDAYECAQPGARS